MINIPIATNLKRRLLIFEEEDSMQTILAEAFLPEKFQVEFVSRKAIGIYNFSKPELILLDYNAAPSLHGENFCKRVKTIFPNIPLIVISAYPLNNFGSYNNHMDLFIAKPFDLNYFLNCIETCLLER